MHRHTFSDPTVVPTAATSPLPHVTRYATSSPANAFLGPAFAAVADALDIDSSLLRFTRSHFRHSPELRSTAATGRVRPASSPLAKYRSPPLKLEDQAVVIDGVLVSNSKTGRSGSSSVGSNSGFYKTRICALWAAGTCHHGHKCKFAHGMEDMRSRSANSLCELSSAESATRYWSPSLSMASTTSGSSKTTYASVISTDGDDAAKNTPAKSDSLVTDEEEYNLPETLTVSPSKLLSIYVPPRTVPHRARSLQLSSEFPFTNEVDIAINKVLYNDRPRKRLPVFEEICSLGTDQ